MSIEEIKSIKKLYEMLKSEIAENKKLKEHCEKVGIELGKYTYDYDYKPKNLVVQAIAVNQKLEDLIEKFVQIYITRAVCFGCPHKPKMGTCENYEGCFERIQEVLNDR